ncbi:hypothetical protein PBT90_08320 [Algoriphagus halophytocola]|uniref:DUF4303 domain-containing protein n=1 Tax=Algoriphagus halophytocola TaxID=2991499 RepID=A0ABY6MIT4_9BACT|nr:MULTISPECIES: hypothetical protein [unclassified Algoriphagus]UZD23389.1 hypothetical protein OM944_02635 [Algoriphagus sp. TR-M5]WBL44684.1 hypothetical protein PBT90_08320 [Algoriphagus sp. TR-M9]
MSLSNPGFDPNHIAELKEELAKHGKNFKIIPDDENSDEFVNFYFIGMYEGREVIYDAALYTLRLHHSSEVYEIAEHKAAQKFPDFNGISYEEDENGNMKPLTSAEEEIGWFITEIIMEMEEEETVKVQEFVDIDTHHDFGIGLDAALNVEAITPAFISKFIQDFNDDTLVLDDTLYAFQSEEEDIED